LRTRLPGSEAALRDGTLSTYKAQLIMNATELLDRAEAAAAEEKVLDRAGRLTPGSLRAAIARAAMEVAPKKARKRREAAAKKARVQCWAEDSGNAALEGRSCPRPRPGPPASGSPPGRSSSGRLAWTATWTTCAPWPTWTYCSTKTQGPARTTTPAVTAPHWMNMAPDRCRRGFPAGSPSLFR
jgi:Domain of unknown function (DUF222)